VHKTADGADLNGYLAESVARFHRENYVTGRIELVDKNELFAPGSPLYGQSFRVGAYTAGYTRDFSLVPGLATGLGFNVASYSMPGELHAYYGRRPAGFCIFLRVRLRAS
jgi:acetoin utilization deacetylase AcuC-like enzyme